MIRETGANSWVGKRVRKDGEYYGTITEDLNGWSRDLYIKMDDGSEGHISMNNMGDDKNPAENARWEWLVERDDEQKWYRF